MPLETKQTAPVSCACTGVVAGTKKRVPRSNRRDENRKFVFIVFSPIFIVSWNMETT